MITTAVIMAAGLGIRFGRYTEFIPKGFVKVGGKAMIQRSIETLIRCGIQRIIIGTGYQKEAYEKLAENHPEIVCCENPRYAETNSMYTFYQCREAIGDDDFLLLESDLIFEERAIRSLLECPYPDVMLISPVTKFQDQYYIEYNDEHLLTNCSTDATVLNVKGELVGIHKLSNRFYQTLCNRYAADLDNRLKTGYEYELLCTSQHDIPVYVLKEVGLKWYEIDEESDLIYAEKHIINTL